MINQTDQLVSIASFKSHALRQTGSTTKETKTDSQTFNKERHSTRQTAEGSSITKADSKEVKLYIDKTMFVYRKIPPKCKNIFTNSILILDIFQ